MSILLHLYVAKHFHVEKAGTRVIDVRCERCNCEFFYELIRGATGDASAPYYIAQAWAEARAIRRATNLLAKRLANDLDLVACPKCQWVNANAIRQFRRSRYLLVTQMGWYAALAAGAIGAVMFALDYTAPHKERGEQMPTILLLFSLVLAAPLLAYALRAFLRSHIDPNFKRSAELDLPAGTPKGQIISGEVAARPVIHAAPSSNPQKSRAVAFHGGRLVLPNVCCQCLSSGATKRLPWAPGDSKRIAVPLCETCGRQLLLRWWKGAGYVAMFGVAAMWVSYMLMPAGLGVLTGCVIAIILSIFGLVITNATVLPYQFKVTDTGRRVYQIAFRNDQYNEMVRQACAELEAARAQQLAAERNQG